MKKNHAILVSLTLILLFSFPLNASGFLTPEIEAKYSAIAPTIDGYMDTAEWNDTAKYEFNLTDGVTNIEAWLYVKHNDTHTCRASALGNIHALH